MKDCVTLMKDIDHQIARFSFLIPPLGVVLGLLGGVHIASLSFLSTPLFSFLTLVSSMEISKDDLKATLHKGKAFIVFALCTYLITPLFVFLFSNLVFPGRSEIGVGFILLYCIPSAVVSLIWSGIYSGNGALSVTILIVATCLSPIITPLSVRIFASSKIELDFSKMILSLVFMVVLPSITGLIINILSKGRCTEKVTPFLKPISKVALLLSVTLIIASVSKDLIASFSLEFLLITLLASFLSSLAFFVAYFFSWLFHLEKRDSKSVIYASSLKNVSASLLLAVTYFPPTSALPIISGIVMQQIVISILSSIVFKKRKYI